MDWEGLAAVDISQIERNESLLDSLYQFLETNELSTADAARAEPGQLARILAVTQAVMKVPKPSRTFGVKRAKGCTYCMTYLHPVPS